MPASDGGEALSGATAGVPVPAAAASLGATSSDLLQVEPRRGSLVSGRPGPTRLQHFRKERANLLQVDRENLEGSVRSRGTGPSVGVERPHRSRIERSRGRLGTMGIVAKAFRCLTLSLGCGVRAESGWFGRGTGARGLCGAVASISGTGTVGIPDRRD